METYYINANVCYSLISFKSGNYPLSKFVEKVLQWSQLNEDWFNEDDNYQLLVDFHRGNIDLKPEPITFSFEAIMEELMKGKRVAVYDSETHKLLGEYKYNKSGNFAKKVHEIWASVSPDEFFKLRKKRFVVIEEKKPWANFA